MRTVGHAEVPERRSRIDPVRHQLARRCQEHPLLVVAAVTSVVAVGHAVWIWQHRLVGALDPDEAGYIATSLRMHGHLVSLDLPAFARSVGGTGNGVVVPLLSLPFSLLGGRDPRAVMMVQPALLVLTAVATAGITRRMAGPAASIAAGLLVAGMPMTATAAQSFWYGLGATTALAAATWVMLSCDRGLDRRVWLLGAAVACMVLTRTMTLGFVPALAVGALVLAGRDLRRLRRLLASIAAGLLVALPWYIVSWSSTFDYLFSYGYGPRAGLFGSGGPLERMGFRWNRLEEAFGPPVFALLLASAVFVAVLVGLSVLRRPLGDRLRNWLAVSAVVLTGGAALVSTSNAGVWFELPIAVLVVPLMVAVIARGPRWYSAGLSLVVAGLCLVNLASSWWWFPYDGSRLPSHYELGFVEYDLRFAPNRRDEHADAAAEWDRVNRDVLAGVRGQVEDVDELVVTMSGNMQMLNQNSLALTGELEGWAPVIRAPDTVEDGSELDRELTATTDLDGRQVDRVLVLSRHDRILFTPDAAVADFADRAERAGWVVVEQVALPGGGTVQILRRPGGGR